MVDGTFADFDQARGPDRLSIVCAPAGSFWRAIVFVLLVLGVGEFKMRDGYENQKHAKKQRHQSKEARKAQQHAESIKQDAPPSKTKEVNAVQLPVNVSNVVPIKPPVPEIPIDHPSRHWQTLAVLGLTLAFLFWLRQDALDQYWQQTRHLELGLSKAIDSPNWQSGAKWTKDLDRELGEKLQGRQAIKDRLVQSFNVLLFGLPETAPAENKTALQLKTTLKPSVGVEGAPAGASAAAVSNSITPQNGLSLNLSKPSNSAEEARSEAPLTQFVPLNEEGRMVLSPQDKVLLVGDSMMQGVAPHVARALQNVHVKSIDLSRQSTGLTYPGYYDWPAVIKKALEKDRISVLVVFLGANDTWDMILGGKYESFGTERWQSNYLERVQNIVQTAHQQHVRVIWLGAPNMGRDKINRGVKVLNSLYAKGLGEGESRYVSTRESLSDDVNEYRKSITKENGKSVVVRTEDGIHFTRDGQIILRDLVLKQFELPVVNKVSP